MYKFASWNIRGMNQPPKQKEVRQVLSENKLSVCAILESHVAVGNLQMLCSNVFSSWQWTSNSSMCSKSPRIILGWNPVEVDLMVVSCSDQVIHAQVRLKDNGKLLMCSFIYAHNRYVLRRELWTNLAIHKQFVGTNAWCLMGDFNATLSLDDHASGSSLPDIAMREFNECVSDIEVHDVNRIGLQYTWNQKPHGSHGVLKKLDRILANDMFETIFAGSMAMFQPYRTSDHSPAILRLSAVVKFRPKHFKFSNLLVHHSRFKEVVSNGWSIEVVGFPMYRLVQKLKSLKKPLRKLLFEKGNLHERVAKLRIELDVAQQALDKDPFNPLMREEAALYLQSYNEAVIDEERFLKQKAKIEWLRCNTPPVAET